MKGQLKVSSPEEYIARVEDHRKADIAALDALIRTAAPDLEPFLYMGMLGYGPYRYKYESGREGDGARIALASNKGYISLYVSGCSKGSSLAERYERELPKANIGNCCVRFKRLSDLDYSSLEELIRESSKI